MKRLDTLSREEMQGNCEEVSQVLKALAHPQRLMILCLLAENPRTVGELQEICAISQSAVSQFLNRFRLEGIVRSEKSGNFVTYEIANPQILSLIKSLHKIYC